MSIFFYDTETTGLPRSKPHIVQIAARLMTDDAVEIASLSLICRPDGWDIPKEVSDIHGITTDYASRYGIHEKTAVTIAVSLALNADIVCGHNVQFDDEIMSIAANRFSLGAEKFAEFINKKRLCTSDATEGLLKLPPTQRMIDCGFGNKFKKPRLAEAYKHLLGKDIENAHNAMADVNACMEIFFHLNKGE